MSDFLRRHWIAVCATFILWIWVAILLRLAISRNQGHWVYTYDDAYIHLAIARNLAEHGIWGVTRYGFTSSASSLLWPLLLTIGGLLTGAWEYLPLALNMILATVLVWVVYFLMRRYEPHPMFVGLVMLLPLLLVPLAPLVMTGMEHVLQIILDFLFMFAATRVLLRTPAVGTRPLTREDVSLLVLAPLAVMARFEGMFIVDIVCLLLAIRGRWALGVLLGMAALLPVGIYGLISLGNHWYFLPNSVLLKGTQPDFTSAAGISAYLHLLSIRIINSQPALLLLVVMFDLLLLQLHRRRTIWYPSGILSVIILVVIMQHLLFAAFDFRYGAYLIAAGVAILALSVKELLATYPQLRAGEIWRENRLVLGYVVVTILFVLLSSLYRGWVWNRRIVQSSNNIYQQQYQMAEFVREYYSDRPVVVNDIGAVSYFGRARTVDLVGLASMEVARIRRANQYTPEVIHQLVRGEGAKVAIVYDAWFDMGMGFPPSWIKVGEWKINDNVICGSDVVAFYATVPVEKERLIRCLQAFSSRLPSDIVQRGEYTGKFSVR